MPRGVLLRVICIAGALSFAVTTWRLIDSPLRFDETEFARQAGGILEHGVPKVLYHDARYIPTPGDRAHNGSADARYGMWHPPLYLYSLAGFRKLLGPDNWALRVAGLIWLLLTAAVLVRAVGRRNPGSGVLAVALAVLSPLVAHGTFFIDIDNTALTFALVWCAAIVASNPGDRSLTKTLLLSAVLLLALWSKLTTPVVFLVALLAYHLLNRDWRGTVQVVAAGLLSALAFAVTYLVYCRLTGYSPGFMFHFSYLGKLPIGSSLNVPSVVRRLHAIWWNVVWFSPALSLLLTLLTLDRAKEFWRRRRRLESVDFWVLFAWACFGAYAVAIGVMGKYTFPAAIAAAAALALWLPAQLQDVRFVRPATFIAASVGLLGFQAAVVPPLIIKDAISSAPTNLMGALTDPRNVALLLTLGGFGVFAAIARRALSGGTAMGRTAGVLVACAVVANSAEAWNVMVSPDDRSPYRAFREQGYEALIVTLNRRLSTTDTLIAPKDVGFYFHGWSYATDVIRDFEGRDGVAGLIREGRSSHAADSLANPALGSAREVFQLTGLVELERIGDFVLYGPPR
jgi:dolichyl-phosphate-mannose-protein mannosyltransferase